MQIEISKAEVEMLQEALKCWQKEPVSSSAFGGMLTMIAFGKENKAEADKHIEAEGQKAKREAANREIKSTMFMAKVYQSLNRESEFLVDG
ncbi:MAG: hypothetical protein IAE97_00285 [Chthoniobacterales bacterium]|nr:hypothetical protein [Chthoniobacterales bacterium]